MLPTTLSPNDCVEVLVTSSTLAGDTPRRRWVSGTVIDCEIGCWPLVQLSDGQVTELRPYMTWRATKQRSTSAA